MDLVAYYKAAGSCCWESLNGGSHLNSDNSDEFNRLWMLAYLTALRILSDPHEAQDVAQETMLSFWNESRPATVEKKIDAPQAWVRQVAMYIAWRVQKRLARMSPYSDVVIHSGLCVDPDGIDLGDDQAASSLLAATPPLYHSLFRLRYLEGEKVSDIARILSIPEGTVKSRLHSLRRYLANLKKE